MTVVCTLLLLDERPVTFITQYLCVDFISYSIKSSDHLSDFKFSSIHACYSCACLINHLFMLHYLIVELALNFVGVRYQFFSIQCFYIVLFMFVKVDPNDIYIYIFYLFGTVMVHDWFYSGYFRTFTTGCYNSCFFFISF